jgi:hypothetical protein
MQRYRLAPNADLPPGRARHLPIPTGLAAVLFLVLSTLTIAPAYALPDCSNSQQIGNWEAYGDDLSWDVSQRLDSQYRIVAGDDLMLSDYETVWVGKVKDAAKVTTIRLAVDGMQIGSSKPSDKFPFELDERASQAAIAAFRKGRVGSISIDLENGGRREMAIDLAGFTRAMNTAIRFSSEAERAYEARTCESVL